MSFHGVEMGRVLRGKQMMAGTPLTRKDRDEIVVGRAHECSFLPTATTVTYI